MTLLSVVADAITLLFLLVVLSYYVLLFRRHGPRAGPERPRSLTIVVPAHNEEAHIAECLGAILAAKFDGRKEIIVIDDGSRDRTAAIVRGFGRKVRLLSTPHTGKAAAINLALRSSKGALVAIVDADSVIAPDALAEAIAYLRPRDVAAVCATVKVRNRRSVLGMWLHVEQLYNSLVRGLFAKANANIVTPGPLSVYKRRCLGSIGGFETKGFSEDVDVAVRLIKAGYHVEYAAAAVSETYMPITPRGFLRQRSRFARGWINIFKRHLRLNRVLIDIYTLPLALFSYLQAVIMGAITIYTIASGYSAYFASQGVYVGWPVVKYFVMWLSVAGVANWVASMVRGDVVMTAGVYVGLAATLLSYPLYLYAVLRYDRRLGFWNVVPLLFLPLFWLLVMAVYIANLPELFRAKQHNIWEK